MDRLEALRVLSLVAERASFAEAARLLRISPTKASRAVAEIEAYLGVALLNRTTRSVVLTKAGAHYLERARAALAELDEVDRTLKGEGGEPRGLLVITAPVLFGQMLVRPVIGELLRRHPKLDVRLLLLDRVTRLVDEGVDVAVRIADLSDSALTAVRLREVRRLLVASPAYVEAHGEPSSIAKLERHALISFDRFAPNGEWRFAGAGRPAIRLAPRLITNDMNSAIDAAIDGVGIARVFCYQVAEHVAAGRLLTVLEKTASAPVPVNLVFQPHRQRSAAVRAFLDLARKRLRQSAIE